jgi:hypothetical protein
MSTPDQDDRDTGDGSDSPRRALLIALAAMAGVAVLVGLAVGAAAITVLNGAGVGEGTGSARSGSDETLFIPRYQPTRTVETDDLGLPSPSVSESESESPSEEPSPRTDRIKLFGAPQSVGPGERINFNGVYVDGEGVPLQIQRKEGAEWIDFPVEATVRGGVFSTWIQTTRTGEQAFRVLDETTDRVSNVVVITVG